MAREKWARGGYEGPQIRCRVEELAHLKDRHDVGNLDEAVQVSDHVLYRPSVLQVLHLSSLLLNTTNRNNEQKYQNRPNDETHGENGILIVNICSTENK